MSLSLSVLPSSIRPLPSDRASLKSAEVGLLYLVSLEMFKVLDADVLGWKLYNFRDLLASKVSSFNARILRRNANACRLRRIVLGGEMRSLCEFGVSYFGLRSDGHPCDV